MILPFWSDWATFETFWIRIYFRSRPTKKTSTLGGYFENITFQLNEYCGYFLGNFWKNWGVLLISTSGPTGSSYLYFRPSGSQWLQLLWRASGSCPRVAAVSLCQSRARFPLSFWPVVNVIKFYSAKKSWFPQN